MASFAVAPAAVGISHPHADAWERGVLGIAALCRVTPACTLAQVIRDREAAGVLAGRVDRARLDRLLAERDPFEKL